MRKREVSRRGAEPQSEDTEEEVSRRAAKPQREDTEEEVSRRAAKPQREERQGREGSRKRCRGVKEESRRDEMCLKPQAIPQRWSECRRYGTSTTGEGGWHANQCIVGRRGQGRGGFTPRTQKEGSFS